MRLDKYLANSGVGTRKEVKEFLKKRKIKINDKLVIDGSINVKENEDIIKYEDNIIKFKPFIYIMLNKPNGVISATEDKKYKTVIDILDNNYRTYDIFPVGRLDIDTEGLLILTNDGKLSHNLLSPNKHVNKKYYVELKTEITIEMIQKHENGIKLEENFVTKNAKIEVMKDEKNIEKDLKKVFITITEGKFHQVKRMFKAVNNEVLYLKRIQMGNLTLDDKLGLGEYRELTEIELEKLKNINMKG